MAHITEAQLPKITAWGQTATLDELLVELTRLAALPSYEGENSAAEAIVHRTIVTRFNDTEAK